MCSLLCFLLAHSPQQLQEANTLPVLCVDLAPEVTFCFWLVSLGPHLAMLRTLCSELCAHGSLLVVLGLPYGMLGLNMGWLCKANSLHGTVFLAPVRSWVWSLSLYESKHSWIQPSLKKESLVHREWQFRKKSCRNIVVLQKHQYVVILVLENQ